MKKSNVVYKTKVTAAILIMAASLVGCSKSDTPGPQGPTGPAGPQGPAGNANIIASGIYSSTANNWGYNGTSGQYYTNLIDSDITAAVINSGAVMVYMVNSDGSNTALPYSNSNGYYSNYVLQLYAAQVQVGLTNGGTPANPGNKQYRVVIIPSALRKAHPKTNWQNYNEVQALMNNTQTNN